MKKLYDSMYVEKFHSKSRIFWEGGPNDKLFFVLEGTVKLTKLSEDGKDLTLHYFFPVDLFGEFDPMRKQTSALTAMAADECVICVIQ